MEDWFLHRNINFQGMATPGSSLHSEFNIPLQSNLKIKLNNSYKTK